VAGRQQQGPGLALGDLLHQQQLEQELLEAQEQELVEEMLGGAGTVFARLQPEQAPKRRTPARKSLDLTSVRAAWTQAVGSRALGGMPGLEAAGCWGCEWMFVLVEQPSQCMQVVVVGVLLLLVVVVVVVLLLLLLLLLLLCVCAFRAWACCAYVPSAPEQLSGP